MFLLFRNLLQLQSLSHCHYRLLFKMLNGSCQKNCNRASKYSTMNVFVKKRGTPVRCVSRVCFSKGSLSLTVTDIKKRKEKFAAHICPRTFKIDQTFPDRINRDVGCSFVTRGNQLMPAVVAVQKTLIIRGRHRGNTICHKQCTNQKPREHSGLIQRDLGGKCGNWECLPYFTISQLIKLVKSTIEKDGRTIFKD